jgi:Zn-dependent protease/CBS domain-containing protein
VARRGFLIGHFKGIPVEIDGSWLLIFIFLTWSLATSYFPTVFTQWTTLEFWLVAGITSLVFFFCVLLHEIGHSVVALHYKIPVRRITLFIFGGASQISEEPANAKVEFWVAVSGPLVSLALGALFLLLEILFNKASPLLAFTQYLAFINISLAVFNLIPGFPLDGGRVFQSIWWGLSHDLRQATSVTIFVGQLIATLFIVLGVLLVFSGSIFDGMWIALIGWFLDSAAIGQKQHQSLHDLLSNHRVSEAISRNFAIIPAEISLQKLADDHILGNGRRFFIVKDQDESVIGVITPHNIIAVPRQKWPEITVHQIMIPADQMHQVSPETNLWEALQKMDEEGVNQQPVIENGQLLGVLSRDGIIGFLRDHGGKKQVPRGMEAR